MSHQVPLQCELVLMPSKNFWPTINLTFISVMTFRTRYASSIAPLASCAAIGCFVHSQTGELGHFWRGIAGQIREELVPGLIGQRQGVRLRRTALDRWLKR